jgi:hypothetical protein
MSITLSDQKSTYLVSFKNLDGVSQADLKIKFLIPLSDQNFTYPSISLLVKIQSLFKKQLNLVETWSDISHKYLISSGFNHLKFHLYHINSKFF